MRAKPGDRVGAVLSAQDDVCKFFGYGEYLGDDVPPDYVGGFNFGLPNPRIRLDSGKDVYGCECWWGIEERVKELVKTYKQTILIDIDEYRKNKQS